METETGLHRNGGCENGGNDGENGDVEMMVVEVVGKRHGNQGNHSRCRVTETTR